MERGVEDLIHSVLDCGALEEQRGEAVEPQRPRFVQEQDVVGEYLFVEEGKQEKEGDFNEDVEEEEAYQGEK